MTPDALALVVSADDGLREVLETSPLPMTVVTSAAQAIETALRRPVDAIAVHLPPGASLDALADVRRSLPNLPVVLASESPSYDMLQGALGLGVTGCVTGPISAVRLRDAIADARRLHDEHATRRAEAAAVTTDAHDLEHLRRVFNELPLLILVTRERDGHAVIVDGNPHAWATLGRSREALVGRPLGDIYTPESRRLLESGGYGRALTGEFFAEERQLVAADGRTIETLLRAIPDEGSDGERGTIAFFADITDSKRNARQLQQSQARQLALLDAIPDVVLRIGAGPRVVDYHVPGGSPPIAGDGSLADGLTALGLPAGLAAVIDAGRREALAQRKAEVIDYGSAVGSEAAFVVRIVPSGDDEVVAILQDVTEHRRVVEALRLRDEALRQSQKMESIGLLAGGVAHDFNNLLTAILGAARMVLESFDGDDPRREDLALVETAAERAAALTGQLLAFSRRQVLEPQRLDVHAVLVSMTALIRGVLQEGVEFILQPATDPAFIDADRDQLEQSILNLAVNASAAMPHGGTLTMGTARVRERVGGNTEAAYVVVEVRDTGIGMTAAVQARIFEPFFTTKPTGKGTGLGLSMVYGFTQQSGGRIEVESALGQGTSFRLFFPEVSAPPTAVDVVPAVPTRPHRQRVSGTVLLVEDEPDVRRVAARILQHAGYTVLEAASADEALATWWARRHDIDVLLSDVVMPGMNGSALARILRAEVPNLKVLLMSGYSNHPLVQDNAEEPARMLHKPFTPDGLRRAVYELLTRPRDEREPGSD